LGYITGAKMGGKQARKGNEDAQIRNKKHPMEPHTAYCHTTLYGSSAMKR